MVIVEIIFLNHQAVKLFILEFELNDQTLHN